MRLSLTLSLVVAACDASGTLDSPAPGPLEPDDPTPEDLADGDDDDDDADSEVIFADFRVVPVEVEVAPAALAALAAAPYEWVEAVARVDGEDVGTVGFRLKGQNSFRPLPQKAAFKIDFDRFGGEERWDLDGLTFNNMVSDASALHEAVAYRFFREFGVPAPRSVHARVQINGEDYGLYALVEDVDADFLQRWFDADEGSMFEVWDADFTDAYVPLFQWEAGPEDRSTLQAVADALESPGSVGLDAAFQHVDQQSFLRYWAGTAIVAQFDSWPYGVPGDDCHVYDEPTDRRLRFIPHGMDEALDFGERAFEDVNAGLAQRCRADPACRAALHDAVGVGLDLLYDGDFIPFAEALVDVVRPELQTDPKMAHPWDEVLDEQGDTVAILVGRRGILEAQMAGR